MEEADLEAVFALNVAAVPAVASETRAALRDIAAQALLAVVALEHPGAERPAGFCIVLGPGADYDGEEYAWFSARYADFAYVDRVVVDGRYRQRGVGRALYDHVHRTVPLLRPGASDVLLEVNAVPPNPASMSFHRALGYLDVGELATPRAVVRLMARPLR